MTAHSLIAALNIIELQHGLLYFLLDLTLKSVILLAAAFTIQFFIGGRSPSTKSLVWMMTFVGLLLLPLYHEIVPTISFSYGYLSELENYAGTAQSSGVFATRVEALASSMFGFALSYLLICGLLICYLFSGIAKVIVLSHNARPFRHEHALLSLDKLQQLNGCHRSVELLVSPDVSSPLTWGLWRHKILFPLAANGWSDELLQQTISHELAHVQRSDWVLQIVARTAVSLFWINPIAWLAHRKLLIETEKACDDVAVENSGSALSYAQNLLQVAVGLRAQRSLIAPALLGIQSCLSQRIRHILKQEVNRHSSDTTHILPSLIFTALIVAPFSAMSVHYEQIDLPRITYLDHPIIEVSFFPNDSKEHISLMAEFR